MTKIKDGWHRICGADVYVENGRILRATKNGGTEPAYPYKPASKKYGGGWDIGTPSVSAFRRGPWVLM